eukprot:TRINITY_DN2218_c0_g1_i10.p1 TRINITY_DN2218_c0_g1~~TRINITY_DN2218_c0_g1_i10.p1  ORF type:complete len:291 (+),score=-10.21 TRINITY_DN2218_c0_g1_i10:68-874(+)
MLKIRRIGQLCLQLQGQGPTHTLNCKVRYDTNQYKFTQNQGSFKGFFYYYKVIANERTTPQVNIINIPHQQLIEPFQYLTQYLLRILINLVHLLKFSLHPFNTIIQVLNYSISNQLCNFITGASLRFRVNLLLTLIVLQATDLLKNYFIKLLTYSIVDFKIRGLKQIFFHQLQINVNIFQTNYHILFKFLFIGNSNKQQSWLEKVIKSQERQKFFISNFENYKLCNRQTVKFPNQTDICTPDSFFIATHAYIFQMHEWIFATGQNLAT